MRIARITDMDVSMKNDLSDNQRRTICRVLFLLACALPTCVTVYFATHQRTPDQWAQLLKAELGVETSIGVVETPRPDEILFHDVKLYDNDGEPIFDALRANVTLGNVNKILFRNPIRINRKGLSHFLEEASGRLIQSGTDAKPWEVLFQTVEIVDEADPTFEKKPFHLERVHIGIGNGLQGPEVTVSAAKLGEVKFARDSQNGQFVVEVNTKQNTVPCWLANQWCPDLKRLLGNRADFKGVALIYSSERSATSALTGKFDHIDLPHMPEFKSYLVDAAQSIYVDDLVLKNNELLDGGAFVEMENLQQINLKPYFFQATEPVNAPFNEIIRRALLEFSSSSVMRR